MMSPVKIVSTIIAIMLGTVLFFSGWYTVDEGYRGVITRNGAMIGEAGPGFGWKVPFIDEVHDMTIKTIITTWEGEQAMQAYSRDLQQATLKVTIATSLDATQVRHMYATVGTEYYQVAKPLVVKRVKEELGQYTAADVVGKRELLGKAIFEKLAPDLTMRGIILESLQVEDVAFSDTYEQAVESAAKAEADVKTARQELEKARVETQKKVAVAEAEAQATKLHADAEAYQTRARGLAEAEAIKARAEALASNPSLVNLTAVEKWNGSLPATMVPGSAVPFLGIK